MTTRLPAWLAVCGFLLAAAPLRAQGEAPAAPSGNAVELAREHFKAGVEYYRDGDLSAALVEFKRAYEASPNFRLLFNLGQVSQELREYPDASRYYEQYLREAGEAIDLERRRDVELALAKVRMRIAELQLSSDVEDVEYFVDDVSVGHSPFDRPVFVNAGRHRVMAVAPSGARVTEVVDAGGGESLDVRLRFPDREAAAGTRPASPAAVSGRREGPPSRALGPAVWLGIGTGVVAVTTGVFAVLAAGDGAEYRDALERRTTAGELESLHDRATAKALVTDILLGTTVVGGAFTLYFALRDAERSERPRAQLELGPATLRVRGAF